MKIRKSKPVPPEPSPPIVVRADNWPWNRERCRRLAVELAPVIVIMNRLGLAGAGFEVAERGGFRIARDGSQALNLDRGVAERLVLAREAIRREADQLGQFWSLPNAILVWHGLAVELFGDPEPGKPTDQISYSRVELRPVARDEEGRWQLVA